MTSIIVIDYNDVAHDTTRTLVKATEDPADVAFYTGTVDKPAFWADPTHGKAHMALRSAHQLIREIRGVNGEVIRAGGLAVARDWVLRCDGVTSAYAVAATDGGAAVVRDLAGITAVDTPVGR